MKRVLFALLALFSFALPGFAETEAKWIETKVQIGEGDQSLHGSLILPGTWKPEFDAVMLISGSGPTDRDGNQAGIKNDSLKLIALALAEEGIASLRFDKRSVAESYHPGMREEDMRFEMLIEDARNWAAFLKSQPGVKRVFIIGHSEGALIGAVAAQGVEIAGYVILAGAGDKAGNVLRRQIRAGEYGETVAALAEPTIQKLERGEIDPSPHVVLAGFFRQSVQPYLISWFKFDPAEEIKTVPGRVLIVQGTRDLQILAEDAERLSAARPDAKLVLIEEMNHILRIVPDDRAANEASYAQPELPLAPTLMPALIAFIAAP